MDIDLESGGLLISSEVGDRCIVTSSETRIWCSREMSRKIPRPLNERVELADLRADHGVHAYGEFLVSGCLAAGTLIAFARESASE